MPHSRTVLFVSLCLPASEAWLTCDADEIEQVTEWGVQVFSHVVGVWTLITLILTLLIQAVLTLSTNPEVMLAFLIGFSTLSVSTPLGRALPVTPVISALPGKGV